MRDAQLHGVHSRCSWGLVASRQVSSKPRPAAADTNAIVLPDMMRAEFHAIIDQTLLSWWVIMSEQLYLAANLVQASLVFGHLQVVFENQNGDLLEAESTSPGFPYLFSDWVFPEFGRRHDQDSHTPGYGDPDDYAIVSLSLLPGQSAKYVWELLGQVHLSLSTGGHGIDYDINQNSNSYATTLLSIVGIDIAPYLGAVASPSVSGFPGVGTNVLHGAKTGGLFSGYDTAIPLSLAGTKGNDYIATGIGDDTLKGSSGADTIFAGAGQDDVRGGGGHDLLSGGNGDDEIKGNGGNDTVAGDMGNDILYGIAGNDVLSGGSGADDLIGNKGDDTLSGGSGNDTLDGKPGDDVMTGDEGADTFLFNHGIDEILDFEDDVDQILIAIRRADGATTGQQIIDSYGRLEDGFAVLDFGRHELKIANVTDLQILADDLSVY